MKIGRSLSVLGVYVAMQALVPAQARAGAPTWTQHENLAPVVVDGKKYSATCSGFPGTDAGFKFWTRKGSSKSLVVYFEGGGACWDNLTCTFPDVAGAPADLPQFFASQIPPGWNPSTLGGIFRTDRAANPVRDWNMVYVPNCTGDLHMGSATKQYASVGNDAIGLRPHRKFTIQHRGFDNFMVVLDWIRRNADVPDKVLVTGDSAGGYGATVNSPWIGRIFPQAQVRVVADSSQGVTTAAFDSSEPGRESWNPQLPPWVFGTDPLAVPSNDLMRRAAVGQPMARLSQFTTSFDQTQIEFYAVMKEYYGPGGQCLKPAIDWYQQMSRKLVTDAATTANYRYYVAGGAYHTLLSDENFYNESSAGPTFARWLGEMLVNHGGTAGTPGGWFNAACPTCLIDWPCRTN
jgi:hypothetical protein